MVNEQFISRFWSKVSKIESCWFWQGAKNNCGYGHLANGGRLKISALPHRISWYLTYGKLPGSKIQVCHGCDNKLCVNPSHLFLGTAQDNQDDKVRKDRQAKGERVFASVLTENDVIFIKENYGRISVCAMARQFGVRSSTIAMIVTGKNWRWVK